jgi:hypothetical protein
VLVAAAAWMLSSNAIARFHAGAGAAPSRLNDDCADASRCDNRDTGFKLFGGHELVPNRTLEANNFDVGRTRATGDTSVELVSADLKRTAFGDGVCGPPQPF